MAENLQQLNESIDRLNQIINDMSTNFSNISRVSREASEAIRKGAEVETAATNLSRQKAQADKDELEQKKALKKGVKETENAVVSFGKAILSTEKNFSKYSDSLTAVTQALGIFATAILGPSRAIAAAFAGLAFVGPKILEQTDNLLKATDQLNKLGVFAGFTTSELVKTANQIGVTSKNLDLLINPIRSLGSSLVTLGSSTADGAKRFAEIADVGSEVRKRFNRLGISQGELIQLQTEYINLQKNSAMSLSTDLRVSGNLQSATLKYVNLLQDLSALTGDDINQTNQRIQQYAKEYEFNLRNFQLDEQLTRAKGEDRQLLLREKQARQSTIAMLAGLGASQQQTTAIMSLFTTGGAARGPEEAGILRALQAQGKSITEYLPQNMARQGLTEEQMNAKLEELIRNIYTGGGANILGMPIGFNREQSQALAAISGLAGAEDIVRAGQLREGKTIAQIAAEREAKGKEGADIAKDMRASLTEIEIAVQTFSERLLTSINPLIGGFNEAIVALGGFAMALGALGLAMSAASASSLFSGGGGGAAGKFAKLGSIGRGLLGGGAVAAAGYTGASLVANNIEDEDTASNVRIGGGIVSGMAGGAMTGAQIGSFFSPLGTVAGAVIGGAIGGALGYFGSSAADESAREKKAEQQKLMMGKDSGLTEIMQFTSRTGSYSNFMQMDPAAREAFVAMAKEYNAATEDKLQVNSSFRSKEDQLRLYNEKNSNRNPVAKPGTSKHELGLAVDVNSDQARKLVAMGLPQKYGFNWLGEKDPPHFTFKAVSPLSEASLRVGGQIRSGDAGITATLHPNEIVQPLKSDSILQKLSQTPASMSETQEMKKMNDQVAQVRDLQSQNAMMVNTLAEIKDALVNRLDASIDIQDRMLRYTQLS